MRLFNQSSPLFIVHNEGTHSHHANYHTLCLTFSFCLCLSLSFSLSLSLSLPLYLSPSFSHIFSNTHSHTQHTLSLLHTYTHSPKHTLTEGQSHADGLLFCKLSSCQKFDDVLRTSHFFNFQHDSKASIETKMQNVSSISKKYHS